MNESKKEYFELENINNENFEDYLKKQDIYIKEFNNNISSLYILKKASESEAKKDLNEIWQIFKIINETNINPLIRKLEKLIIYFYQKFISEVVESIYNGNFYNDISIIKYAYKIFKQFTIFLSYEYKNNTDLIFNSFSLFNKMIDKDVDYYKKSKKNYKYEKIIEKFYTNYNLEEKNEFIKNLEEDQLIDAVHQINELFIWTEAKIINIYENSILIKFHNYSSIKSFNKEDLFKNIDVHKKISKDFDFDWRDNLKVGDKIDYKINYFWELGIIEDIIWKEKNGQISKKLRIREINKLNEIYDKTYKINPFSPLLRRPFSYSQDNNIKNNDFLKIYEIYLKSDIVSPNLDLKNTNSIFICKLLEVFYENGGFNYLLDWNNYNSTQIIFLFFSILKNSLEFFNRKFINLINKKDIINKIILKLEFNIENNLRDISTDFLSFFFDSVEVIESKIIKNKSEIVENYLFNITITCINSDFLEKKKLGIKFLDDIKNNIIKNYFKYYDVSYFNDLLIKEDIFNKILSSHDFIIQKSVNIFKYLFSNDLINEDNINNLNNVLNTKDIEKRKVIFSNIIDICHEFKLKHYIFILTFLFNYEDDIHEEFIELLNKLQKLIYYETGKKEFQIKFIDIYYNLIEKNNDNKDWRKKILDNFLNLLENLKDNKLNQQIIDNSVSKIKTNENNLVHLKLIKKLVNLSMDKIKYYNEDLNWKFPDELFELILTNLLKIQKNFNEFNENNKEKKFIWEGINYFDNIKKRLKLLTYILKLNLSNNYVNFFKNKLWDLIIIHSKNYQENNLFSKWALTEIKKFKKENIITLNEWKILFEIIYKKLKETEIRFLNNSLLPNIIIKVFYIINQIKDFVIKKRIDFENYEYKKYNIYIFKEEFDKVYGFNELWELSNNVAFSNNNVFNELLVKIIVKPDLLEVKYIQLDYNNEYKKIIEQIILNLKKDNLEKNNVINFLNIFLKQAFKFNTDNFNTENFYCKESYSIKVCLNRIYGSCDIKCKDSDTLFKLILKISKNLKNINPYLVQLQYYDNENSYENYYNNFILRNLYLKKNEKFLIKNNNFPKVEEEEYFIEGKIELKDEIKLFFKKIFENYSENGQMNKKHCAEFTSNVLEYSIIKENDSRIREFYEVYDTNKDDLLEFEDFLKFFTDSFHDKPRLVWENLKSLGFKKNFKRINEYEEYVFENKFLNTLSLDDKFIEVAEKLLLENNLKFLEILKSLPPLKTIIKKIYNFDKSIFDLLDNDNIYFKEYYYYIINLFINLRKDSKKFKILKEMYEIKYEENWINNFIKNGCIDRMINDLKIDLSLKNRKILYFKNIILDSLFKIIISSNRNDKLLKDNFELIKQKNHFENLKSKSEKEIMCSKIDDKDKNEVIESNLNYQYDLKLINRIRNKLDETSKNDLENLSITDFFNNIKDLIMIYLKCNEKKNSKNLWMMISILYNLFLKNDNKEKEDIIFSDDFKNIITISLTTDNSFQINSLFRNFTALIFKNIENNDKSIKEHLLKILVDIILYNKEKKNFKLIELTSNFLENLAINDNFSCKFDFEKLFINLLENLNKFNYDDKSININLYLKFMKKIVEIKPDILLNIENSEDLPKNLFENLLFPKNISEINCNYSPSWKYTIQWIIELCKNNLNGTIKILFCLLKIKNNYPIINEFKFSPYSIKKSNLGYVGIKNLGCICYMNSMIQQFYNIPTFRYGILAADDKIEKNIILKDDFKYDDNLFHQFQDLFAFLEKSHKKFYDPKSFCLSFKDYTGQPINPFIQQDAQEFLNMFFDKLENGLKASPYKNVLDGIFRGKNCNILKCESCNYVRKNSEIFYNLSLEVKNLKSLEEGLKKLILEETILDYNCDNCKEKCNIKKCCYIEESPNFLIIHLQRIIFDLEIFMNTKVNSHYSFPKKLNLKEVMLSYFESNNKDLIKDEDYDYNLKGVTCHNGNAEYGHYYSFINVNKINEEENWLVFDDSKISKFDFANLEEECFGEKNPTNEEFLFDYTSNFDKESKMNNKSAYLLVYEKVKKHKINFNFQNDEEKNLVLNNLINPNDYLNKLEKEINIDYYDFKLVMNEEKLQKINKDNENLFYEVNLYNSNFLKLLSKWCDLDFQNNEREYIYIKMISSIMISFFLDIGCIINLNYELKNFRKNLIKNLEKWNKEDFLKIFKEIEDKDIKIQNILINNSDKKSKNNLYKLFIFIINKYHEFSILDNNNLGQLKIINVFETSLNYFKENNKNFHKVTYMLKIIKKLLKFNNDLIEKYDDLFNLFSNYFLNNKIKEYDNNTFDLEDTLNEILAILNVIIFYNISKNEKNDEITDFLNNKKFYKKIFLESKKINLKYFVELVLFHIKNKLNESILILNYILFSLESRNRVYNFNEEGLLIVLENILNIKDEFQLNRIELILGFPLLKYTVPYSTYNEKLNYGIALEKNIKANFYIFKNPIILSKQSISLISLYLELSFNEEDLKKLLSKLFLKLINKDNLIFEYFLNLPALTCLDSKFLDGFLKYCIKSLNLDEKIDDDETIQIIINRIKYFKIPNYLKEKKITIKENYLTPIYQNYLYGKLIKTTIIKSLQFNNKFQIFIHLDKIAYTKYETDGKKNNKINQAYLKKINKSYFETDNIKNTNFYKFIHSKEEEDLNPILIDDINNGSLDDDDEKLNKNDEYEFYYNNSECNLRINYYNNGNNNFFIKMDFLEFSDNIELPKNKIYQRLKNYKNNENLWELNKIDLEKPFGKIKIKFGLKNFENQKNIKLEDFDWEPLDEKILELELD